MRRCDSDRRMAACLIYCGFCHSFPSYIIVIVVSLVAVKTKTRIGMKLRIMREDMILSRESCLSSLVSKTKASLTAPGHVHCPQVWLGCLRPRTSVSKLLQDHNAYTGYLETVWAWNLASQNISMARIRVIQTFRQ